MNKPCQVSVVNYLNSKPFIYGLEKLAGNGSIELVTDIPSVCADKLMQHEADAGLVPVAVLPQLPQYRIFSNYCIGANGPVDSVLLLSDYPLQEITTVLVDYHSRTSALLLKILCDKWWNISPDFFQAEPGYERQVAGPVAGLVIGDRALAMKDEYSYVYDLSEEWKKHTLLPFVFACWVAGPAVEQATLQDLETVLADGVANLDKVIAQEQPNFPGVAVADYLRNKIDYRFCEKKKVALELFLSYARQYSRELIAQ